MDNVKNIMYILILVAALTLLIFQYIGLLRFLIYEFNVRFSKENRFVTMRKCRKGLSIRDREYPYV